MTLVGKVQKDLVAAMKAKDALRLGCLRMLKTALHNRKVEKGVGSELDEAEAMTVVKSLVKQRREAATEFRKGGANDRAQQEEEEITVLDAYLPAAVSEDAIREAVEAAVKETGAVTVKDMGKVMKAVMGRFAGQNVDGKQVSQLVRQRLATRSQ
jgi:uncharacterized protein YqeY